MLRVVCAVSSLLALTSTLLGNEIDDKTNIDPSWNRSWPAGPFSQVSTSFGVLQTSIPICSIEGPGGTSIGFSLYHRSNQFANGFIAAEEGYAGRGWIPSAIQEIVADAGATTWKQGGNSTASWTIATVINGVPTYARTPGTRADIVPYMVNGTIRGWDVTTQGDKTKYIFRQERVAQQVYRLTQIIDTHGNAVNYTYDSADRVTRITDASGVRYIQINYTADVTNKQIANIVLNYPGGSRQWVFSYSNFYLGQIDFPAPITGGASPNLRFSYYANSNLQYLYDLRGSRWKYTYAQDVHLGGNLGGGFNVGVVGVYPPKESNPTSDNELVGCTFDYTNFTSGPATGWTKTCEITDRRGWLWKHVYYNNGGNPWFAWPFKQSVVPTSTTTSVSDLHTWNYTDATLATHTDYRGWMTSFTYDTGNRGLMLSKTDREGWLWQWRYYQDKVVTQIDPTLNRTIYAYYTPSWDLAHVTVDPKTDPFDGTYNKPTGVALKTNYTYTASGEIETTWKGTDSPTTLSSFDAYGNARTTTSPLGIITTQTFDELNNKTSATLPSPGGTTNYAYDNWNRLTRTTFPDATYTESTYDNNGNVLIVRDPNGFTSSNSYNAWNWLGGTRTPVDSNAANDIVVEYFYDADGHRVEIENGRDKSTFYDTDARGKVWRIRYPDGTDREFEFDANGNTTKRWDGQGRLTTYAYDKEDRQTITTYPNSSTIANVWRSDGLRDRFTDATGTTQFTYNGARQIETVYQPLVNKTVEYDYDAAGRRLRTGLGAQTWHNTYDVGGRLRQIDQNLGAPTPAKFSYYTAGPLWRRINGNDTAVYYDYDSKLRPTVISHRQTVAGIESEQQRIEYTYDDNGNVLTTQNAMAWLSTWNTAYTYDRANRLKSEVRTGGIVGFNFSNAYNYDKSNNRTSVVRDGVTSGYTVDNNDKLLTGDGYTLSNYSSDGNPGTIVQSGYGTITFQYDYENRPTRIDYPGGYSTYKYNGDGQRVESFDSVGSATKRFVYDGSTVIAETNSLNQITYFHLPGVGWNGSGGTQFYDRENALGSSLVTVKTPQTIESIREYDAFGITYQVQAGDQSAFRFAGKHGYHTDDATGLQLLGARYYMPKLGRFVTQDPIGQAGGLNLYAYCNNNPLSNVDPDGKSFWDLFNPVNHVLGAWSWFNGLHTAGGWAAGVGQSQNFFTGGDMETLMVRKSAIGQQIDSHIKKIWWWGGKQQTHKGSVGSKAAFLNSLMDPLNGTQWQLGAVSYTLARRGNVINVEVTNQINWNSFFYHIPQYANVFSPGSALGMIPAKWDRASNGFGPMGQVYQSFNWSVPVPPMPQYSTKK